MNQDIRLYGDARIWDQPLQLGQHNLLQAIRDFWPSPVNSVLDVGCGDGKLTSRLARSGAMTLVGLDSSEEALSRLPFARVRADATRLPFADGAFDLVMSTDVLEHMPSREEQAAWSEMFRVANKAVMVAVPFREELLDATARCSACHHCYHVNWHQRSYDLDDLLRRTPSGWMVQATVLTGEPWSAMLPPETRLRREALDEWSGWELAICPACGAAGEHPAAVQPLPSLLADTLAEQFYTAQANYRYCRSHSEILVIFQRESAALPCNPPPLAQPRVQPASMVDFIQQPAALDLQPYSPVAQYVMGAEGCWRVQFPLYDVNPVLEIRRLPNSHAALQLRLDDAAGCLWDGCVLEEGQERARHALPRPPVAGYYGVLASCPAQQPFASIALGQGPSLSWVVPQEGEKLAYLPVDTPRGQLFVQCAQAFWLDPQTLSTDLPRPDLAPSAVLAHVQTCFERTLARVCHREASVALELRAQMNELDVQLQNLTAERDGLLMRAEDAERLAVQLQNLTVERDGLLMRAEDAERLAVQLQNLAAERDGLLMRAEEAERQAVQLQNVSAERDGLLKRAEQAERLAVQLQNVTAERDDLNVRAEEAERLAVQLQNLSAERDGLLMRAEEAERLAVQLQNLTAERDGLLMRAEEAERLAVQLQNLTAERETLVMRAEESERLAVQLQNLTAERETLVMRAEQAERLAVQLQNLTAERDGLLMRAEEAERLAVQLQNLTAERDGLLMRAENAERLAVQLQNLTAERDGLLMRAENAERLAVQLQNLTAERDGLLMRAEEAERLAVQLQNLTADRDGLLMRAEEAERLAVQLQNLTAERDGLLMRAEEAERLAVQLQNLTAERDGLFMRAEEAERLTVQLQNLTAERDGLFMRAEEAERLAVQLQNLTAERDGLLIRAEEAERLAVQLQNLTAERETLVMRAEQAEQLAVELQACLQQISGALEQAREQQEMMHAENQQQRTALQHCQAEHEKLRQHFENRLGVAVRRVLNRVD